MNNQQIDRISESIRKRAERPIDEQFNEMVGRGAIDAQGNVLVRGPREIFWEQFGQAVAVTRADSAASADLDREDRLWNATLMDGLDSPDDLSNEVGGYLEGILHERAIGPDRPSGFMLADVLTGDRTVCLIPPNLHPSARAAVGRRVALEGPVLYGSAGLPVLVNVDRLTVMPTADQLPQFGPGKKINITNGVPAEDYVRAMRDEWDDSEGDGRPADSASLADTPTITGDDLSILDDDDASQP